MYIDRDDLIDRFGVFEIERLEKHINDPQAIDKAINDASEMVNSYLASRYHLPLLSVPSCVVRAVSVVARFYLYKDKPTDSVRQDYNDVLLWLKDVSTGKVKLPIGTENENPKAFFQTGAFVV